MERIRISEARAALQERSGVKLTNRDIADAVFSDPKGKKLSQQRKEILLSQWDNGASFGPLTPGRLKRLAKVLQTTADKLLRDEDE